MSSALAPGLETPQATERRSQLAEAALVTLSELGYARTSLREIAQNSPFSHGVVHYYFADKRELMAKCVELYVERATVRYTTVLAAEEVERFEQAVVDTMRASMREDMPLHRIFYDLRTTAMFDTDLTEHARAIDDALRERIWAVVTRYAELKGTEPLIGIDMVYALFDGALMHAVMLAVAGKQDEACEHIELGCRLLMAAVVPDPARHHSTFRDGRACVRA